MTMTRDEAVARLFTQRVLMTQEKHLAGAELEEFRRAMSGLEAEAAEARRTLLEASVDPDAEVDAVLVAGILHAARRARARRDSRRCRKA